MIVADRHVSLVWLGALAGNPSLQENPSALFDKLGTTARQGMHNGTGRNNPSDFGPAASDVPCASGYCHLQYLDTALNPITFADACGDGMVNAESDHVQPPIGATDLTFQANVPTMTNRGRAQNIGGPGAVASWK